jgi:hypothetical protein
MCIDTGHLFSIKELLLVEVPIPGYVTGSAHFTNGVKFFAVICRRMMWNGRSIAEAVRRWLPTAAARVRARVWQVGFVVDKVASGQVFSEYFGFPTKNRSFHQILHRHNSPGQLAEALRRADHPSKESCWLS